VVFEDGLAVKRDFKRYKLQHGQGNNDVLSISEVVERRFKRIENETVENRKGFAYPPQLLVVDGGKPQVNAAQTKLEELGIDIPVVGIAKRLEEIWGANWDDPVIFPRSSDGLFLLQRIRDEAHRFAITFQRNKQRGSLISSVLDEIPNLGEKRKKELLKHFGSVKKLRQAPLDEIAACPGIGEKMAARIFEHLAKVPANTSVNMVTGEISDGA
jgi:excinuclease ABC subunit C